MAGRVAAGVVLLALSLLAGCVAAPPLAPAAGTATGTPAASAYAPPPTVTPYPTPVPRVVLTDYPAPPTNTPWPTATATATPPLPMPVQGYGDFPELIIAAQGAADGTLALYRVAGDTAWPLTLLPGTRRGPNAVAGLRLAPGSAFAAYLRPVGESGAVLIEVMRLSDGERTVVAELPGRTGRERVDELTPPVWLDDEHLAYTRVKWSEVPGAGSGEAPEPGVPLNLLADIWSVSIDGRSRELLATAAVYRLLGASAGGDTLYATRLLPGYESNRLEGFALVHLPGGIVENLWPAAGAPGEHPLNFTLVTLPDGSPRVLYSVVGPGDTCPAGIPVIWLANPASRFAEAVWTADNPREDGGFRRYGVPHGYLWSPSGSRAFLYAEDACGTGSAWRVDLDIRQAFRLPMTNTLLAWRPEGIVTQETWFATGALQLWSDTGEVLGEIDFPYAQP